MRAALAERPLLVLACVTGLGCGGSRLALAPAPALEAFDITRADATLFLIGDAGGPRGAADRVIVELVRQAREAPRTSAVFFLGDNVYPDGIPSPGAPTAETARDRLLGQASVADSSGLPVYFVPGNHDWASQGPDGWAAIQRAGALLEDQAEQGSRVQLLPRSGCPGPDVVDLAGLARVVMIDTQWWLHGHVRPGRAPTLAERETIPRPDVSCVPGSEAGVIDSLRRALQAAGPPVTVLIGHHPFVSHAEHGGWFPWVQYVLPIAPIPVVSWLWVPVGWIYPLGRRLVAHPQDQWSRVYQEMRRAIAGTFGPDRPLVYAAGHDHVLEVLRQGPGQYYLVSGSGQEDHQGAVGAGDSTAFSSARPGFMRLDVVAGGDSVRLGVTILDDANRPREAFQAWLRP